MAKIDGIQIPIDISISDETAAICIALLNSWMKDADRHLELFEEDDGKQFLVESI